MFLPTDSPNLNLTELFWKGPKKNLISNTYDEAFSDFTGAMLEFYNRSSPENKAMLRQSVGTKLLLRRSPIKHSQTFYFGLTIDRQKRG